MIIQEDNLGKEFIIVTSPYCGYFINHVLSDLSKQEFVLSLFECITCYISKVQTLNSYGKGKIWKHLLLISLQGSTRVSELHKIAQLPTRGNLHTYGRVHHDF